MSSIVLPYFPSWTERVPVKGGGRDPLALSRASDWLVGILLPSIITTTNRARYYSFYPWALRVAGEALSEDARKEDRGVVFKETFERIETAFSISSLMREGRSRLTVVGSRTLRARWDEIHAGDEVDVSEIQILSGDYGGLGQYYEGCLKALGAGDWNAGVWEMEEGGLGSALAAEFEKSAASSVYISEGHTATTEVPLAVLEKSATSFSLDGIRDSCAEGERGLLIRMFLELDREGGPAASAATTSGFRRDTIGLLLHVISAYEEGKDPAFEKAVVQECLFWPHYYGLLCDTGEWAFYVAPECFSDVAGHWRMFCLHQFFTSSTEEVLQQILDSLETRQKSGMTLDELVDAMWDDGAFVEELERAIGLSLSGPADVLDYFRGHGVLEQARQYFGARHPLAEWWLCPVSRVETGGEDYTEEDGEDENVVGPEYNLKPEGVDLERRLARAFAIWAQIHAKWAGSDDPAYRHMVAGASGDSGDGWGVGTCIGWMELWDQRRPSWREAISEIILCIHVKHERVANERRRLDAWFYKEGARFYYVQGVNTAFRSDRHRNLLAILQDLLLVTDGRDNDGFVRLTDSGHRLLSFLTSTQRP